MKPDPKRLEEILRLNQDGFEPTRSDVSELLIHIFAQAEQLERARGALLLAQPHHQGGHSEVGRAIRAALGATPPTEPPKEAPKECGFVCKCGQHNSAFGDGTCRDRCDKPEGHDGPHMNWGHRLMEYSTAKPKEEPRAEFPHLADALSDIPSHAVPTSPVGAWKAQTCTMCGYFCTPPVCTKCGTPTAYRADYVVPLRKERDALRAQNEALRRECASISAELGLPPAMRPAEGEIQRILGQLRARAERAERELAHYSMDAGHADQMRHEANAARAALGLPMGEERGAGDVAPQDISRAISGITRRATAAEDLLRRCVAALTWINSNNGQRGSSFGETLSAARAHLEGK